MFKINQQVRSLCPQAGVPINSLGIIVKGPQLVFERNFYVVSFSKGNHLMSENCLTDSQIRSAFNTTIGELVILNSTKSRIDNGTKGIVTSERKIQKEKGYFEILFEGQEKKIRVAENNLEFIGSK